MNCWHLSTIVADTMDASFGLLNSVCLVLSSRILLMDLTLARRRSFSAFSTSLKIFLAFSVLKVDFNLRLTGTNSLEMHFKMKSYGSYTCSPLI